jgi:glycolate oxidase iron-sulfur subunit
MLVLDGCVQPGLAPNINTATARVLSRLGVELKTIENAACCGAISHHLSKTEDAQAFMRKNIDAWWPHIEVGVEAIVITASGCGSFIKEYAYHLRNDRKYADKAKKISALSRDVSEVMSLLLDDSQIDYGKGRNVAFHAPCSLQHGQKINGVVEGLLERFGFILTPVADGHLCCGSAGTYSLLQSDLSQRLLTNKLIALQQNCPDVIATANIGCMSQLASKADVPVRHWVELIDEVLVTHGD